MKIVKRCIMACELLVVIILVICYKKKKSVWIHEAQWENQWLLTFSVKGFLLPPRLPLRDISLFTCNAVWVRRIPFTGRNSSKHFRHLHQASAPLVWARWLFAHRFPSISFLFFLPLLQCATWFFLISLQVQFRGDWNALCYKSSPNVSVEEKKSSPLATVQHYVEAIQMWMASFLFQRHILRCVFIRYVIFIMIASQCIIAH